MRAEIISVGSELLRGELVDTNAPYLATQFLGLGIEVPWISAVGDDRERLAEVISRAWQRSDITVLSGGLGPTEDDLTRQAIAQVMGEKLRVDPGLEKWLRDFFSSRGLRMPEVNIQQAMLIPSAQPLPNPRGTAPGWWVEKAGRMVVALPGPPMELERMWEYEVLPRLKPKLGAQAILTQTLKTFGLGEGSVDETLTPILTSPNPVIGIYAKPDGIHITLTAKATTEQEARGLLDGIEHRVKELLGAERIWGRDKDTLEGMVGELLVAKGLTLATMESCTGGLLANTITDVPGSSRYFQGGLVSYTNVAKIASGVPGKLIDQFGAISPQVAEAMATAARHGLGADIGVGITGVAGPEPVEGKPVGTVFIAIDAKGTITSFTPYYRTDRLRLKRFSVSTTLFQLQKLLRQL